MPLINLDYDLGDVKSDFEPLPEGQYMARLTECELVKSSTGKDMLKITWSVIEGEFEGRRLWDNVVLSVDWKVKQYADLAGIESGSSLDTDDFKGIEALLTVGQREIAGRDKPGNDIRAIALS